MDPERATEQQANSSKQRQTKKRTFQESEEEIEPEDALNLMFEYFDRKFEGMQAQINKNMEPPVKNYKPDGHDIKGKGNKDQFDFNTEISTQNICTHSIYIIYIIIKSLGFCFRYI